MVVFICNACGDAVKKNAVEKHCQTKCRRCEVLSCADCGKEFRGNEYEQHVKCIGEDEKYGGKNFKPKAGANKGEQKQEKWVEQVQEAIAKANANPQLQQLLARLSEFPNIPRKKSKFENFIKNVQKNASPALVTQAWEAISSELNKQPTPSSEAVMSSDDMKKPDNKEKKVKKLVSNESMSEKKTNGVSGDAEMADGETSPKAKRKRHRKRGKGLTTSGGSPANKESVKKPKGNKGKGGASGESKPAESAVDGPSAEGGKKRRERKRRKRAAALGEPKTTKAAPKATTDGTPGAKSEKRRRRKRRHSTGEKGADVTNVAEAKSEETKSKKRRSEGSTATPKKTTMGQEECQSHEKKKRQSLNGTC